MKAGVAVLVVASGCLIASPVMRFGAGKTAQEAQHDTMTKVTPPALVVHDAWKGDVRTAKIRVWADDDYRAQNMHWQQSFQDQLDYTNEVLASQFGVRLDAEFRQWNHHAPGAPLGDMLTVLTTTDPGHDVLTVVGLTSSLSLVSATFEQLGLASTPGRHLMIRGYADLEERAAFDRVFRDLLDEERASLYQARRRHKTAAILLHELAHNLGALHQPESDTLMNSGYSDHSTSFDAITRDVLLAALDARVHGGPKRSASNGPRSTVPAAHTTLVIIVDASGRSIIGGNALDDETLDGLFRLSFDDDRETEISIKVARTTPQSAVIKVIDLAKAAGLQRISVTRN